MTRLNRRATLKLLAAPATAPLAMAAWPRIVRATARPAIRPGAPVWLDVDALALHAPIEPVWLTAGPAPEDATTDVLLTPGEDDLQMSLPSTADTVGWYALGSVPGQSGGCLLVGHLDTTTGPAIFAPLPNARIGTKINLQDSDGQQVSFAVDGLWRHPAFDPVPAELVALDGPPRLYLVTCTGRFVRSAGGYQERLIVSAAPI